MVTEKLRNIHDRKHDAIRPLQTNYVKLIQWFGEEKKLNNSFNIENYENNHRLIPYGDENYGLYQMEGYTVFDNSHSLNTAFDGDRSELPTPLAIIRFDKQTYKFDKGEHNKFWEWFYQKNEKRYKVDGTMDYKAASHNVRLLRTGLEILQTGEVLVKRPDAEELLAIRHGSMTYDELIAYADSMDGQIKEWYKKTDLPKKPDIKLAANVLMEMQDLMWETTEEAKFGVHSLPLD